MAKDKVTVQGIADGEWLVIYGHGCETEEDMHEYVKSDPSNLRVAEESRAGELAPSTPGIKQ